MSNRGDVSQQERFQTLYTEISHMGDLLDQYLMLAGCRPAQAKVLRLDVCMNEVLRLLRSLFIRRKAQLRSSIEGSLYAIYADERQVKQILINLLINAMDALPEEGGSIELIYYGNESSQQICIKDNGCGMDEETQQRIFEPFFTSKENGCGLGLPICRQLAQQAGGDIHVISKLGKGSMFVLSLPTASRERMAT